MAREERGLAHNTPPEWAGLEAISRQATEGARTVASLSEDRAWSLLRGIDELTNNELEENRYYGLGLVMCGFARLLQQPEVRRRLVHQHASQVAYRHWDAYRRAAPLTLADFDLLDVKEPYSDVAQTAVNAMPIARHALVDGLVVVAQHRWREHMDPHSVRDDDTFVNRYPRLLTSGKAMAQQIGLNAIGGVLVTMSDILRYGAAAEGATDPEYYPMDAAVLRNVDTRKLATNFATLRMDEFNQAELRQPLIKNSHGGRLIFNRAALPKYPVPAPIRSAGNNVILHDRRLGCEAIKVKGLIPLVLDILPEVVETSQHLINNYFGAEDGAALANF